MPTTKVTMDPQALGLPAHVANLLDTCAGCVFPRTREEILDLAMGGATKVFEVGYDVPGRGSVTEATVTRCKNGLAVNYADPYMRRRDPECMVVADPSQTDKARYTERFGETFERTRTETFEWLREQQLMVVAFTLGGSDKQSQQGAMLIAPANAGFFVGGLADLQGMIPLDQLSPEFRLRSVIYLAPPFRHTHFEGKQVVVHNRLEELTIHPREPLIFLNVQGTPGSTCLIWEHIEDQPGRPCPNPRVIMPRRLVPDVVEGTVENYGALLHGNTVIRS